MEIKIKNVSKYYYSGGKTIKALDNVNLTIPANQIFTLLGPSGCGKTTLLRCIVGLESPDTGEIAIGGEIVWSSEKNIFVPTENRGLGMVFQTYAIWPHMNVFNNVAYPLQTRKMPKNVIRNREIEAELVGRKLPLQERDRDLICLAFHDYLNSAYSEIISSYQRSMALKLFKWFLLSLELK
jgi:ABC-type sugar transport system ATPase subunit